MIEVPMYRAECSLARCAHTPGPDDSIQDGQLSPRLLADLGRWGSCTLCEERVLDGPASGGKGSKGRN